MNATIPAPAPAIEPQPVVPTIPTHEVGPVAFPPSAELAGWFGGLQQRQVEVDRRRAEELARLRAIQDRD